MRTNALRGAVKGLWWLVLLRGILLIAVGILALVLPGLSVLVFIVMLAAWAVVDGVILIGSAISARKDHAGWGWLVVQGVL